ncbi:MAG: YceI family protein [Bacteriovoracales bacterium]|nr:YceI family protein [Bacteriovoracales bacterium]
MKLIFCALFSGFLSHTSWASCSYTAKPNETTLTFTGYKFTEKAGVSGTFKKITWDVPQKAHGDISSLLAGASVSIDSYSIDAGNAARNKNITKGLFKNLPNGRTIKASVQDVKKDSLTLKILLGSIETQIPMNIQRGKESVVLTGTLDLLKAKAHKAFQALAKICGPLHKGKDGKRKTWPTVDLKVDIKYTKKCS